MIKFCNLTISFLRQSEKKLLILAYEDKNLLSEISISAEGNLSITKEQYEQNVVRQEKSLAFSENMLNENSL